MRILHVVGDSKFGGGSAIIMSLTRMARSNGWSVDVLTTDPVFQNEVTKAGARFVDLDVIRRKIRPLFDLKGLLRLRAFLRRNRYHIIHTHTSKAGFIGRYAAYQASVPILFHTVHGFAFHPYSSPLTFRFYTFLEKIAARWCHRIITVSHFHRKQALSLRIGTRQQVVAIPNGISPDRLSSTEGESERLRRNWKLSKSEIIFAFIGRLSRQKGIIHLLESLPLIERQLKRPFRLILVGEGEDRRELETKISELGIEHRVLFTGFLQEVGTILSLADIIVLPSLWEGLSVSLLEAMAAGKAIVTTAIPSNLEATDRGRAAILVPPGDPVGLSEGILRCARDPELAFHFGKRAKAFFIKQYTEHRMVGAYERLYRKWQLKRGIEA